MSRFRIAIALLALVFGGLGTAQAIAAPVDQASWAALKKEVRLANGLDMAYLELGDPKGEPLLLLHGYTDTSRSWSLLVPYLGRYRLLIPDQRGHGASGAPECCYSLSAIVEDARLFLDAVGVERAAVAGHSLGSMVAMNLAADHPQRVSKIALIGSTALAPVKRGDWLWDNAMGLTFPIDKSSQFMRDWDPANQPNAVDPAFAAGVRAEMHAVPRQVWRGVMRELVGVPVARHSADVKAPVLVLSGGKDPLFTAEHHQSLLKAFPNAQAEVYPDLGHNLLWERPADIATRIDRFLAAPAD